MYKYILDTRVSLLNENNLEKKWMMNCSMF